MRVKNKKIHLLIIGVSYFGTMAKAMRIRNLVDPLENNPAIRLSNLIINLHGNIIPNAQQEYEKKILFLIIDYNIFNLLSIASFFIKGCIFVYKNRKANYKNILYVFAYPNIENMIFILFAKLIGYKVVFDIADDYNFADDFKSIKGKFKTKSSLLLLKKIEWIADGCCVISTHLENLIKKLSSNKFPIQFLPISVNLSYFPKDRKNRKQYNTITFFYGGSFGQKDGIEILLNAFSKVAETYKNVELILTGTGAKRHIDILKKLLEKNQHTKKISYLGYLSNADYFNLLSECDVMCMTRVNSSFANTGFPFKLGEYLAASKTVIASQVGDVTKYLTHMNNAIIVEPENELSIAQAMIFCIQNQRACKKIGKNGRKVAEEYFDSKKISDNLLEFLQSL